MAHIPTPEEVKKTQEATRKAEERKLASQQKQGKDFIIPEDRHYSGVIPEAVWKNLPGKKISDPEATE